MDKLKLKLIITGIAAAALATVGTVLFLVADTRSTLNIVPIAAGLYFFVLCVIRYWEFKKTSSQEYTAKLVGIEETREKFNKTTQYHFETEDGSDTTSIYLAGSPRLYDSHGTKLLLNHRYQLTYVMENENLSEAPALITHLSGVTKSRNLQKHNEDD